MVIRHEDLSRTNTPEEDCKMGLKWLSEQLEGKRGVTDVKFPGNATLSLVAHGKRIIIYSPSRDEYILSVEAVQRAKSKGATHIVYDVWVQVTGAAEDAAKASKVKIMSVGAFLHTVGAGRAP